MMTALAGIVAVRKVVGHVVAAAAVAMSRGWNQPTSHLLRLAIITTSRAIVTSQNLHRTTICQSRLWIATTMTHQRRAKRLQAKKVKGVHVVAAVVEVVVAAVVVTAKQRLPLEVPHLPVVLVSMTTLTTKKT